MRKRDPYSAGRCTRWQDDAGVEYLIPSSLTRAFRCNVLNMRRPPLLCDGRTTKPMTQCNWKKWLPKLREAFIVFYDCYRVPPEKCNGRGRRVEVLKRYQNTEDKYRETEMEKK